MPVRSAIALLAIPALFAIASIAHAQPADMPAAARTDSAIGQRIESTKGFVASIPVGATLDSARSGTSITGRREKRVYVVPGAGEIVFNVTVGKIAIPDTARETPAYSYIDIDSVTKAGTAFSRVYYLPTRSVRIDIVPFGVKMRAYIDRREKIFESFRWMPGADTEEIDVIPMAVVPKATTLPREIPKERPKETVPAGE